MLMVSDLHHPQVFTFFARFPHSEHRLNMLSAIKEGSITHVPHTRQATFAQYHSFLPFQAFINKQGVVTLLARLVFVI